MPWRWEPPRGIALSTGADHTPAFSPDGERFAFVSDRAGNNQIFIARRDGSESRQLTSDPTHSAGSPQWSPDGAWIAFDAWASNQSHVYIIPSAGGVPRRLAGDSNESWTPTWSHDGAWIFFSSDRSGALEIWKAPVLGGAAVQITHTGAYEGRSAPDGQVVFFRKSTPAGCCAIWSASVDGGHEEPVRELERFPTASRSWAVFQEGICFIAKEPGPGQTVRLWRFSTHDVVDLVRVEKDSDWSFPGLAMSQGARALLTVQVDREVSDLTMIENFH
jgi:Tol biopolymer transport system component